MDSKVITFDQKKDKTKKNNKKKVPSFEVQFRLMNKYSLSFANKSLENEYFYKVAFPRYNQIFSAWCKILVIISIPCSLFTYFTGNLQYMGFIWCIVMSCIAMMILRYKKSAFNIVVAVYNVGFVVLNVGFIYITDKNIGAEGQSNNMMFIFAGSQYIFHFILSIGSNFLLNTAVIFVQNFSYSAVFFPGTLNSFHGLLFFSMCFLIWMKYTNEKYQRDIFLLQENEKEWSSFVRDVLPSSVIMVKYDINQDQIKNKLVNRAAQFDYGIKDDQSLTQFLRNTIIQKDPKDMQSGATSATGVSILRNSILPKHIRGSIQNGFVDTLERFIYYRFKRMTTKTTSAETVEKKKNENQVNIVVNDLENSCSKSPNIMPNIMGDQKFSMKDSIHFLESNNISPIIQKQNANYEQSANCSSDTIIKDKMQAKKNNRQSFFIKSPTTKLEKSQQQSEQYKVEEFKAQILKNNNKVEVSIKIVFYNLSCPVCSISIDEGLKQQVQNISRQSIQKETIYFQHFQKIAQKFQKVILTKDIKLLQPRNLLHLNHLRNVQDLIQMKQDKKLRFNYSQFQLTALLQYINNIYTPILKSENIHFSIQICHQYPQDQNLSPIKKTFQLNSELDYSYEKNFLTTTKNNQEKISLVDKITLFPSKKSLSDLDRVNKIDYCTQYEKYDDLHKYQQSVNIFNDQQRICQVIINLIENASDFLIPSKVQNKQIQLLVKIIHGLDDHSNLIEFKIVNNTELNYQKQNIYLIKDSLRVEREVTNMNFIWQSQTQIKPTQLGLKLNQKILEKTSPFNYMDITCNNESVDFSFLIYQDCAILMQASNINFQNRRFDQIRDFQIEQNQLPNNFSTNDKDNGNESEKSSIIMQTNQQDKQSIFKENSEPGNQKNEKTHEEKSSEENDEDEQDEYDDDNDNKNIFQLFSQAECLDEKKNTNNIAIHEFESKHIQKLNVTKNN